MDAVDRLFALVDSKFPEQKDFAAQLGITPSIVSEWRRGKSESFTKQKYIGKIAEILNTTTEYILTGKEERPVWGDRIFEKCGIGRDERGDGGKTLEIRGKRRLSARDGGANYQQS